MKVDKPAVVVPAIGNQSSTTCIRSLGSYGLDVIAVAQSKNAPAVHSKYCSEVFITPGPSQNLEKYASTLLELAKRTTVQTITPHCEGDIYTLSKYKKEFSKHIGTPWPDFKTLRKSQDRLALLDIARKQGVNIPETKLLTDWENWDKRTIIKPRYSTLIKDGKLISSSRVFPSPGDSPSIENLIDDMGHVPIVQEYVPGIPSGNEHGFYALYDNGNPIAKFQHRRIRSGSYTGGASVYRKSVKIPDLEQAGASILDALNWDGPAMVEFKRNPETNKFILMEVNPRFWGSLCLGVKAGIDFPVLYYQLAVNQIDKNKMSFPSYKENIGCHLLLEELFYLINLFRVKNVHIEPPRKIPEFSRVIGSILNEPNFDLLDLKDLKPFFYNFFKYL